MATSDFFLKIDGIEGESKDSKHQGEIEVLSWSMGAANEGTMGRAGGGGAGKVVFSDMQFTKEACKASPKLLLACATGQHIKKAVLTARKAGNEQQEFLVVTMEEVLVSSFNSSGGVGSSIPQESFALNFAKIVVEYKPQKEDGSLDSPVKAGFDVKKNVKV
jgi:type VI secretion system secreted protein Hcp